MILERCHSRNIGSQMEVLSRLLTMTLGGRGLPIKMRIRHVISMYLLPYVQRVIVVGPIEMMAWIFRRTRWTIEFLALRMGSGCNIRWMLRNREHTILILLCLPVGMGVNLRYCVMTR